jgi:hypothetical protein
MVNAHLAGLPAAFQTLVRTRARWWPDRTVGVASASVASASVASASVAPRDDDDDLRPGRGFVHGILLAVPLWGLIGMLVWVVLGQ